MKEKSDGSIECYKARLVAQGFKQSGVYYGETFNPFIKPVTIQRVISIAITSSWAIRQLYMKNAFLHGYLNEEVYMRQPPGFTHPDFPEHVCRLRKAIYGLKQAPWAWFQRFSTSLFNLGFTISRASLSLFIYKVGVVIIYLLLYVDDIIITGNRVVILE